MKYEFFVIEVQHLSCVKEFDPITLRENNGRYSVQVVDDPFYVVHKGEYKEARVIVTAWDMSIGGVRYTAVNIEHLLPKKPFKPTGA